MGSWNLPFGHACDDFENLVWSCEGSFSEGEMPSKLGNDMKILYVFLIFSDQSQFPGRFVSLGRRRRGFDFRCT